MKLGAKGIDLFNSLPCRPAPDLNKSVPFKASDALRPLWLQKGRNVSGEGQLGNELGIL